MTSKRHDAALPNWSVTTQLTTDVPMGNMEPDAGVELKAETGAAPGRIVGEKLTRSGPHANVQTTLE